MSLQLMDGMRLLAIVPLALSIGLSATALFVRSKQLTVPIWYSKQFIRWSAFILPALLIIGLAQINRGNQTEDIRKTIIKYQEINEQEKGTDKERIKRKEHEQVI